MKKTLQKLHEQEKLYFSRGNLTLVTRLTLLLKTSVSPDKYQKIAPCKGIQDSLWILLRGFLIPDSRYRIPASLSLEQSLVGFGILELYSGFQSPGFQIPQAKISQIPWTKKTNKNTQTKTAQLRETTFLFLLNFYRLCPC